MAEFTEIDSADAIFGAYATGDVRVGRSAEEADFEEPGLLDREKSSTLTWDMHVSFVFCE